MNAEKEQKIPPLTLLQSLLFSEIGRYQEKDGQSFIILEASPHLDEYFDAASPVYKNRKEPLPGDVLLLIVSSQVCEITINICGNDAGARPFVVIWPLHSRRLPDKFIIRKSWDKTEVELEIAQLVDIYRAQESVAKEEIEGSPIYLSVPSYLEQMLEHQLAAAGYELLPQQDQAESSQLAAAKDKQHRTDTQRRRLTTAARTRNSRSGSISTKN